MNHDELELKLRVPAGALSAVREALQQLGATTLPLRALYFDTADGRLAAARLALRLRLEGGRWVQTLKAPGDSAVHRLEHEVELPYAGTTPPPLDLGRHHGHPALDRLREALHGVEPSALQPVLTTEVDRLHAEHRLGETVVELALDTGHVAAGVRRAELAELELELKAGPAAPLFVLAAEWTARHGLWLSTLPKAARGLRLLQPAAPSPPTKARPLQLGDDAGAADFLRETLRNTLDQVLANLGEIADGEDATDLVHQARVGLRRLRTALRELQALSPALDPAWGVPLAEAFARLGERRDEAAVSAAVQPLLQAAHAPMTGWPPPPAADLAPAVQAPALQAALIGLLALSHAGDERFAGLNHAALRRTLAKRLQSLWKRVRRDGMRFDRLTTDDQHRVRKRLKRLRYLAEFARPLWPHKAVDRCLDRLKPAQEALGQHNDVAVAADRFRAAMAAHPEAGFAAGWLQAYLAVTARDARKALCRLQGRRLAFWREPGRR
ncbi:CHAD domain-containing protein [Aquabacterium sp. J223]|uniref:CYTH and CHAD domain-containing protein n=1 Tax=Aquabacterium sp. J223 TaxID=2898431 RepID=UPI0021ADDC37|nr:CHAD domain-containing protein [Aquabacterium sp. J223]UUX94372.1 CHAD domain-containing protein [Aquabacterium sp. J223]